MSLQSVPLKTILMYHADVTNETLPLSYAYCDGSTLGIGTHDIGGGSSAYTLPDLRNRFILGADITKAAAAVGGTTNSSADAPGPKGNGGVHAKTLATTEIPSHSHTATTNSAGAHTHTGSTADNGGAHSHTGSISTNGAHAHSGSAVGAVAGHTHGFGREVVSLSPGGTAYSIIGNGGTLDQTTQSGGAHTPSLTITADGDHSHTLTVTSGGAHTHTLTLVSDGSHTHAFTTDVAGGGTAFDTRPRYYGLVFIMKVRY